MNATYYPAQLPTDLSDATPAGFGANAKLEQCRLTEADLGGVSARAINLDEVLLEKVNFVGANLNNLDATDVVFGSCDLSAAKCGEAGLRRVRFDDSRMTGWDCNHATIKEAAFKNCKLDMTNFRVTKMTRVRFVNCVMTEADFMGAELTDVVFESCTLERVDFSQCKLKRVDLRGSQLADVRGTQYLRGAKVTNAQLIALAPSLAGEFGIEIAD